MCSIRNEARLKRPVNLKKPKLATHTGLCNSPSKRGLPGALYGPRSC